MQIKVNKYLLINKLKSMNDNIILITIYTNLNILELSDDISIESFKIDILTKNIEVYDQYINKKQFIKKLQYMNDFILYIKFDKIDHKITITNKNNTESSIYFCSLDTATNIQQTI